MLINWISQYLSRILLKLKKYGRTGDQKGGREDNFEQSHLPAASPGGISSVFLDSFSVISRRHLFCLLAIRRMSCRSFFNLSSRCCVYRILISRQWNEVASSVTSTLVMYRRGHASHSYPVGSFLLLIPPLVPHVETFSCAASVTRASLFTSRLTSHIMSLFHRKFLFSCCIQSFSTLTY